MHTFFYLFTIEFKDCICVCIFFIFSYTTSSIKFPSFVCSWGFLLSVLLFLKALFCDKNFKNKRNRDVERHETVRRRKGATFFILSLYYENVCPFMTRRHGIAWDGGDEDHNIKCLCTFLSHENQIFCVLV